MTRTFFTHLRQQWMGALALFFVLTGGTAYALDGSNTVFTDDIVNDEVRTQDIAAGHVTSQDIGTGEVLSEDIGNGQVALNDLAANSVNSGKIVEGGVQGSDVLDDDLTDADIATGAVRTEELRNGQVQAEDLAPGVAPGASGARAWGLVSTDGPLFRSKNVTAVTHEPDSGIYCIDPGSGIDPTTAVMVVGEETFGNSTNPTLNDVSHVEADLDPEVCPPGTMEVETFVGDGSTSGFDLRAQDESFTFVIP